LKKILFTASNKLASLVGSYPVPSKNTIPEWYKRINPYIDNSKKIIVKNGFINSTVKLCSPFLDAMSSGYMAVLQDDIIVSWENGNPQFNWRTTRQNISFHDTAQSMGVPVPEGYFPQVIKFDNDIEVKTPNGYSLFCTHPSNRFDLPFQVISGFVDSDKYNLSIKFPFFIKNNWEGIIEKNTPIVQLIPVKRESWGSKIEEFNEDSEIIKTNAFFSSIGRSYKKNHWVKKIYE
jgi:hypothetical protein